MSNPFTRPLSGRGVVITLVLMAGGAYAVHDRPSAAPAQPKAASDWSPAAEAYMQADARIVAACRARGLTPTHPYCQVRRQALRDGVVAR